MFELANSRAHFSYTSSTFDNRPQKDDDDDDGHDKELCNYSPPPWTFVCVFGLWSGLVRIIACLFFSSSSPFIRCHLWYRFPAVPFVLLALVTGGRSCHLVGFAKPQSEHSAIGPHHCSNCVDGLFAERGRMGKRGERRNSCLSLCNLCCNRRWRSRGQEDG